MKILTKRQSRDGQSRAASARRHPGATPARPPTCWKTPHGC
ncbi:hypothetical protein [Mycobacterium paraense]|nr:hypothetical protein [Mycobacterium paraense]